jgi:hypothetical protein
MTQVVLKSKDDTPLKPLILSALEAEQNELKTGILKTRVKLAVFEKRYNLSTNDFLNNPTTSINELEAIEWSGEYETLKRLEDELSRLLKIEICS